MINIVVWHKIVSEEILDSTSLGYLGEIRWGVCVIFFLKTIDFPY